MLNNRFTQLLCIGIILVLSGCEQKTAKVAAPSAAKAVEVPVVRVEQLRLNKMLQIPGELSAFQNVAIEAKVQGYISSIDVDRGARLKRGDKILTIFCPELKEHEQEEEAKYSSAVSSLRKGQAALDSTKSKLQEAKARLEADVLTLQRLEQTQAKMPGSVAVNDIDVQTKTVESDRARLQSMDSEVKSSAAVVVSDECNVTAALKVVKSVQSLQAYLTITAPFDGVITERNVHVGSMVGPEDSKGAPLVRIQQRNVLRLVVAVPEDAVAGLKEGQRVAFRVPAFLGEDFFGILTRPAYAVDTSTRTMPVELDVRNTDNRLQPGMFATVQWPISRPAKTLFVPATSVATDLQGTFVNVVKDGVSHRETVEKGQPMRNLVEVVGPIKAGDEVILNANDELKSGTHLVAKIVNENDGVKN